MSEPLCIVAGVGPGNGLAIARAFGRQSHRLALIARDPARLEGYRAELAGEGLAVTVHSGDLGEPDALRLVLDGILAAEGPAAVMVHNGGVWNQQPALTFPPAEFHRDLAICVTSALVSAQAVAPGMRAAGRGAILFTGGGLALYPQGGVVVPSLTAGKSAVRGLAFALAGELRPLGIRVGTVTVAGMVQKGTAMDPDRIAEAFLRLAALPPQDQTVEIVFDGKPTSANSP